MYFTEPRLTFGADPELFIENTEGDIVGSEKVIADKPSTKRYGIIRDGVQVELNAAPSGCRGLFGNGIVGLFRSLDDNLKKAGYKASFKSVVEVSQAELDSLSEASRKLGCAPSNNYYNARAKIEVPDGFRTRSAGGHIHLGLDASYVRPKELVPVVDTLVGNTCVLVDRDPAAAERRKVYGRAGEFRTPRHGLEYRTLSNFWLRSCQLMSMVLGLSRLAVMVGVTPEARKDLMGRVDELKVERAINTNDRDLALENFEQVSKFLQEHVNSGYDNHGLNGDSKTLADFHFFHEMIHQKGIEFWFQQDPMQHWTRISDSHYYGWESYLKDTVHQRRRSFAKEV